MPTGIYERTKRPVEEMFWEKVDKSVDCWEWTACEYQGYGQIRLRGKLWKAHRFSWFLRYGKIPKGLFVCHHCDNPACVNPEHLFLGTQKDNMQDAVKKGRMQKGMDRWCSKLTEAQVLSIRREYAEGKSQSELARKYGVDQTTIHYIVTRKTWKHI